jgi:hypothetical protein
MVLGGQQSLRVLSIHVLREKKKRKRKKETDRVKKFHKTEEE